MFDMMEFAQAPSGHKAEIMEEMISVLNPLEIRILRNILVKRVVDDMRREEEQNG